jgi:hypothetical protein
VFFVCGCLVSISSIYDLIGVSVFEIGGGKCRIVGFVQSAFQVDGAVG